MLARAFTGACDDMSSITPREERLSTQDSLLVGICHLSNIFCQVVVPVFVLVVRRKSDGPRHAAIQALTVQLMYVGLVATVALIGQASAGAASVLLVALLGPATVYLFVVTVIGIQHAFNNQEFPYPIAARGLHRRGKLR